MPAHTFKTATKYVSVAAVGLLLTACSSHYGKSHSGHYGANSGHYGSAGYGHGISQRYSSQGYVGHSSGASRYGGGYNTNCVSPCVPAQPQYVEQYVQIPAAPAPAPVPTYEPPTHTPPVYEPSPPTSMNCPSGTTPSSDGTCLTLSTPEPSRPIISSPPIISSQPVNCPSGTVPSSDGTCLTVSTPSYPTPTLPPISYNPIRK